jgi:hypothetical protein
MKIGPMKQNPGWVLCHIFMVGLLSQVMDNLIMNVNVNMVKVKDSAILAGGKTQSVSSQAVEMNVVNKVNPGQVLQNQVVDDVNVDVVNKDNPGQVLQSQVGDNGKVDKLEQVLLSLEDVNNGDAVDAETKEKAVNAVNTETDENMVDEDNPEQGLPSQVEEMNIVDEDQGDENVINPDPDADAEHDEDQGDVDELGIVIDSDSDSDVIVVGIGSDFDGDFGVDDEYDEFFGDIDVIHPDSDSDVIVVGIGSDSDSNGGGCGQHG